MLRTAFNAERPAPLHSVLYQLRDGYMDHIAGQDQPYGPWLNERDVY